MDIPDAPVGGPDDYHLLKPRRLGIDSRAEAVAWLRSDAIISRAEGLSSHNRILLSCGARHIIASLYPVTADFLRHDEIGLSEAAWHGLSPLPGAVVNVEHAPPVLSLGYVRRRIFGASLGSAEFHEIMADIVAGRYSAIDISAFITACAAKPLSDDEICQLTDAMVANGVRLCWGAPLVVDKHSVGGLPGNRTTPVVVSICAALGTIMPKTSSRAITSAAGTADTMEVLAPVELSESQLRAVVEQEGASIAWGGAMALSPADDLLIRIERALDLDSEGQMIASILSKKLAAGVTHLVVDMPVGPTAKIRSQEAADLLERKLLKIAGRFGLTVRVVRGDGSQPIGRGIGPALEARDVLAVLQRAPDAPPDLRDRALELAGAVLELTGRAAPGTGRTLATRALDDGSAWAKFQRICAAQGGMREVPMAACKHSIRAENAGIVRAMDNRRIGRAAKLAGAPQDKTAGIEMHVRLGDPVTAGRALCTIHAGAQGALTYAARYAEASGGLFTISP